VPRKLLENRRFQRVGKSLLQWSFFANFLNRLSLKRIEDDYAGLF
jgi:hypothetical protein